MSKTFIQEGRAYRWVEHNGERRLIGGESSKLTLYDEHGIVFVGPGYSYTKPDGTVVDGYTNEPVFVQAYEEIWAEGRALGVGEQRNG